VEAKIWTVEYGTRPWTTNLERKENRWQRAERTKQWRLAFALLARNQKIPKLASAKIVVEPWQQGGRLADVASCNPSVKAAIDGLVDAGVLEDDSPAYLKSIEFLPPQKGKNALVLHIHGMLE
jgi:crossover junction endodeoxyribonuclease RusA